jgi:hypothetical protein
MKTVIRIGSDQLDKGDIAALMQAIRDCELANFPAKEINIMVEVPELSVDVMRAILTNIKPPFTHGPMVFKRQERGRR